MMHGSPKRDATGVAVANRPPVLGEIAVAIGLLFVYDQLRLLSPVGRHAAVQRGFGILAVEGSFGFEARFNDWMAAQRTLSILAVGYYQFLHVGAAVAVLVWCYRHHPDAYRLGRNALVATNIIGLVVYELYPVAPPRLLPGSSFTDLVATAGFGSSHGPVPMNAYAAMPSLHLAWAVCIALTGIAASKRLRSKLAFALHPIITAFVVVGTGNHYVADVALGVALGLAATMIPARIASRRRGGHNPTGGKPARHSVLAMGSCVAWPE